MKKLFYRRTAAVLMAVLVLLCTGCTEEAQTIGSVDVSKYVTLGEYKGLTMSENDITVSEGDIEAAVLNDLEAMAEKKSVDDRPVIDGDIVNIDYKGTKDGVAFDGGTGNYDLEIGSNSFIEGFEDGVIGMKIGETKDLDLTFPEDYSAEDLAGQDVVFEVTVNSISENVVPSIKEDDVLEKLAKKYDEDFNEVDDYLGYIKDTLEKANEEAALTETRIDLLQQAYDNAECDLDKLPEWLVSQNSTNYISSIESFASQYGVSLDQYVSLIGGSMEEFNDQAIEYGKELSKQQLVVQAIADAENITVSQKEIDDYYSNRAKEYNSTVEKLKASVNEEMIERYLLSEKVQDFLYENAVER
ncbi:MAG: trigger factor [Lachnospiraceae bacterium]|nr:trigger factor [Lachnospiraceae bacterium]